MKNINFEYIIISLSLVILLISCDNDGALNIEEEGVQKLSEEVESSYNLVSFKPSVYNDFFKQTAHSAGISSLKANSLSEPSIVERIEINDPNNTKRFSINNNITNSLTKTTKMAIDDAQDMFGKTISFKINTGIGLSKNGASSSKTEIEMYVPELVEITNPKIESEDELLPICYFKDFVLEWNADPKNEEGLVVIAEYFGNNAIPENSTN